MIQCRNNANDVLDIMQKTESFLKATFYLFSASSVTANSITHPMTIWFLHYFCIIFIILLL